MLISLRIENFAIVSQLELNFNSGMTVFTGETGAGKSIMIDALTYVLGARADASIIREGKQSCEIVACFEVGADSQSARWLMEHELPCEENQVYIRRIISKEGRPRAFINGVPFPLQKIKEFSEHLVDIHGQHEYQTLLSPTTHRHHLDSFANHGELLDIVREAYKKYEKLCELVNNLEKDRSAADKQAFLQYKLDELKELNCIKGEFEALEKEHHLLQNAKSYLERITNIKNILQEDEDQNIISMLYKVKQSLDSFEYNTIKGASDLIQNAITYCEESHTEIHNFERNIQLDPERLHELEARMGALYQCGRKYHIAPENLWQLYEETETELNTLQSMHLSYGDSLEQLKAAKMIYEKEAEKLTQSRIKHKTALELAITKKIQQLGMPHGTLELKITKLDKPGALGVDKVEYLVTANPGQSPDSLIKIASGGELSRISLAIQLVTAQKGITPTLLFDEVDIGIGGATAALVGQMLNQLGQCLQVFCVTHQPQVAAYGDHHFKVEKHVIDGKTYSNMKALDNTGRVDELARMLGGHTITEETLLHAEGLLSSLKTHDRVM